MLLNAFSTAASSVISNCNDEADPPIEVILATARLRFSSLRPLTITLAPALVSALAISSPNPRLPPVTRAIFPFNQNPGGVTVPCYTEVSQFFSAYNKNGIDCRKVLMNASLLQAID